MLSQYQQVIRNLSDRIVHAQMPIRILDALKWDISVQEQFFAKNCTELPKVNKDYYANNPLKFDPDVKIKELQEIERDIRRDLGQFNSLGAIMQRMCREYALVVEMLRRRGSAEFIKFSQQLYGSSSDAFYAGAPTLKDLAEVINGSLDFLRKIQLTEDDVKEFSSEDAVRILTAKLNDYFGDANKVERIQVSDDIIADAAAGAECIKIRHGAKFSTKDLKVLEVHEGWVHLGTTLNGLQQPICTFLSKGPPSSTVTQEGLAIIMEIFTFASHPSRMQGLSDRIQAIHMAENGADFLEVFAFFSSHGFNKEDCYNRTMRVFRGATAESGAFTKDLVYHKGFILIYNYIRLAVQRGLLDRIPLLFLGKTTLEDLHVFADLVEEKIIVPPQFVPSQFKDLASLTSWMCYSIFLNQLDLKRLALEYKSIL